MAILAAMACAAASATVIVVANEDFEDDTPDNDSLTSVSGGPANVGKPGRWIPNMYDIDRMGFTGANGEWFDIYDANPDTNWQPRITKDRILLDGVNPKPGNEMFFQNVHRGNCPGTTGTVDAPAGDPAPCDFDLFARDAFLQFTDATGTPRPAMPGETLRGRFGFTYFWGIPAFAMTNDVQQMAVDDPDLHPPVTTFFVPGFGQPQAHPHDEGLQAWFGGPQHPNAVSLLAMTNGYNGRAFDVWVPQDSEDPSKSVDGQNSQYVYNLDPDFAWAYEHVTGYLDRDTCECWESGIFADGVAAPFATLAFTYTVGNDHYDSMSIDFNDGNGLQEVVQGELGAPHGYNPPNPGGPVPIGQPGITGNGVDGFVFSDTGNKGAQYFIDDICFEIIPAGGDTAAPSGCDGGPEPLPGDANNDNQVTGGDLIAVQQNFGYVSMPADGLLLGDANDDGLVTGADLISVQQNFGNVAAAAVPEPASAALMVVSFLGSIGKRSCRA